MQAAAPQRKIAWYGTHPDNTWCTRKWSCRDREMTAISTMFTGNKFLIAADGRCKSDDESASKERETDEAQKIFPVETNNLIMGWALTGFSSTEDGRFDLVCECHKEVDRLAVSTFSSGHRYVKRFCADIKRTVSKARRDGLMPEFARNEQLEAEERGRIFKLFFAGYFGGNPFWIEAGFYHDERGHIEIRQDDAEIVEGCIRYVGSIILANMMYDPAAAVDPRLVYYKKRPDDDDLEYLTSYIKASSDPIADEIDPKCKAIGGRLHAAEITPRGFRWLISPER
jgi:hypothetical protein